MDFYLWIKALHVIAVIAWMAGMLYLPRLFVYHAGLAIVPAAGAQTAEQMAARQMAETFKIMERRLLRYIINPAMIAAWVFGLWLAYLGDHWREGWLHAKFALLIGMQIVHAAFARWRRHFAADKNRHTAKFYRLVNEIPTVFLIGIVILVIVKPF